MKSVLSMAVPALLLMSASAFAADPTMAATSGASSDTSINPSVSATTQLSASTDTSPTYQGGRKAYRGKSERSLNRSEAQVTAQLNQEQAQFAGQ